jgi:hypothetical protein
VEFLDGSPHICRHRRPIPAPPGEAAATFWSPSTLSSSCTPPWSLSLTQCAGNWARRSAPEAPYRLRLSSRASLLRLDATEDGHHTPEITLSFCSPS